MRDFIEALKLYFSKERIDKLRKRFIKLALVFFIGLFAIFYSIGVIFSSSCYEIKNCKACWQRGNATSQYNAMIDVILCACKSAKANNYGDAFINSEIRRFYKIVSGIDASTQEICEGKVPLIKYK